MWRETVGGSSIEELTWIVVVNPKFWRVKGLLVALLCERRDSRIIGSTKNMDRNSRLEGC